MAAAGAKKLTAGALSRMAAGIYPEGPVLFRALQKYRPYICPFEALIEEVPEGASVLDIGCGSGVWGLAFAERDPAVRVTGCDLPGVLESFQARAREVGLSDRTALLPGDIHDDGRAKERL